MRIGFDAKRAFHNRSGLGNYSRSTIRLLSEYFPENEYFLFSEKNSNSLFPFSDKLTIINPEREISNSLSGYWRSWGIYQQINSLKPDIYHGLSNELPLSIKKTSCKTVVTIHDLIFLRYPEYYSQIDKQIYSFKFRHACRVADKIIATSESTKHDIISFFGTNANKIEVVYQSCDPVFRILISESSKYEIRKKYNLPDEYILMLGTIEKRKNALSLIKAYLNENIDFPLVIAGKSTVYLDEINQFLKNKSGTDRIFFRNNIESADLPALYQSALVFAYPSVFEGFGIPIVESLYSGVPVITSTGSCFAETGGDAAQYCDPYNIGQIGETLKKVLADSDLRKSMIQRGLDHVQKFNESNVASNLLKVYSDLR
jgi:glycosyltransferase involved in cell wall biosynthesis